jgi:hypothetical protein
MIAPNKSPNFIAQAFDEAVQISTAETSLTAPTAIAVLVTAGENGAVLSHCVIKGASAVTVAGMVRFWFKAAADTSRWRLIGEKAIAVDTVGANDPATETYWEPQGPSGSRELILPPGAQIGVTTEKGDTFNVLPCGGQF